MKTILHRLIHGEPVAEKHWTVYYYDMSWVSRILKTLFGLRGCYRFDCDDLYFRNFPSGFASMINKKEGTGSFIWALQVEQYICNFGYNEIVRNVEQEALDAMTLAAEQQAKAQFAAMNVQPLVSNGETVSKEIYG